MKKETRIIIKIANLISAEEFNNNYEILKKMSVKELSLYLLKLKQKEVVWELI